MQHTGKQSLIVKLQTLVKFGVSILGFFIVATLFGECLLRLFAPPHNYLTPELTYHERLGYHIEPFKAGHDGWGFRNQDIPAQVDTVVIGDSFTYGVSVSANDAWPSRLASNVKQPIYNLSLGGYGAKQYQYLLETYAVLLKPRQVIIGLYLGDDIAVRLSQPNREKNTQHASNQRRFNLRHWLAANSFLYHFVVQSPIGDWVRLVENWWLTSESSSERYIFFDNATNRTIFTPKARFRNLDLTSEKNQLGLEALKSIVLDMELFCRTQDIILKVVVFPTKERVFMDEYLSNGNENYPIMNQLFSAEDEVRQYLTEFLDEHQIEHLDLLDPLVQANRKSKLFFQDANGHMAKEGHEVTAKRIEHGLY